MCRDTNPRPKIVNPGGTRRVRKPTCRLNQATSGHCDNALNVTPPSQFSCTKVDRYSSVDETTETTGKETVDFPVQASKVSSGNIGVVKLRESYVMADHIWYSAPSPILGWSET